MSYSTENAQCIITENLYGIVVGQINGFYKFDDLLKYMPLENFTIKCSAGIGDSYWENPEQNLKEYLSSVIGKSQVTKLIRMQKLKRL